MGDILYLVEDQEVPCDAIVLSTSHTQVMIIMMIMMMIVIMFQGQCYVMTANLDGETSLKTRVSTPLTKQASI